MPGEYLITAAPQSGGSGEKSARGRRPTWTPCSPRSHSVGTAPRRRPLRRRPLRRRRSPRRLRWVTRRSIFQEPRSTPEAAPVRVAAGEERAGVNFQVSHVSVASIQRCRDRQHSQSGIRAAESRHRRTENQRFDQHDGDRKLTPPNARGEFSDSNVPPGEYRIVAKVRRGATEAVGNNGVSFSTSGGSSGGGGGAPVAGGPPPPSVEQLFAIADVTVRGHDVGRRRVVPAARWDDGRQDRVRCRHGADPGGSHGASHCAADDRRAVIPPRQARLSSAPASAA